MAAKPIRVAYSPLSGKFYAFSAYRSKVTEDGREILTVTGDKYDVTQDIARAIAENEIEFTVATEQEG